MSAYTQCTTPEGLFLHCVPICLHERAGRQVRGLWLPAVAQLGCSVPPCPRRHGVRARVRQRRQRQPARLRPGRLPGQRGRGPGRGVHHPHRQCQR